MGNRVLVDAEHLRRVAAGQPNLAVIQSVVPQMAAQGNPERLRNEFPSAPSRRIQDCQGHGDKRPKALSFALHAALRALAKAMLRERTQLRTASVGAMGGRPLYDQGGKWPNLSLNLCAAQPGLYPRICCTARSCRKNSMRALSS